MPQGIKYERKLNKWICDSANKGKPIPKDLLPDSDAEFHMLDGTIKLYNTNEKRYCRYTSVTAPLNNWIMCRPGEPIPHYLKNHRVLSSNACQSYDYVAKNLESESDIEGHNELTVTDSEGQNAIAEWIRYRPDEPMPVEFLNMKNFNDFGCMKNAYKFWDKYNPGKPYPAYYKDHYDEDDKYYLKDHKEKLCILEQVPLLIDLIIYHPEITEIPQHLMFKNWQKYRETPCGRSFLGLWIEYRPGQPIPQCLQYNGCAKQADRNIYKPPVLRWIRMRKGEPIPDCLKYDGWLTDYCNNYRHCDVRSEWAILQWVKYRQGEPIPEEILRQTPIEKIKHRLLYLWIMRRKNEPIPDAIKYTDFAKDLVSIERFNSFYCHNTYLNLWLRYRPDEPIPSDLICNESLHPDNYFKDEHIDSPIEIWIESNAKQILLQHKPLTLPEELHCCDNIDDKTKLQLLQLIIKVFSDTKFNELPDLSLIPQELFVDNWKSQRDYQAETPIQRMLSNCGDKKLISKIIKQYGYDGWQQDILKYIYAFRHHWMNNKKNPYIENEEQTAEKQHKETTVSTHEQSQSSYDSQDTYDVSSDSDESSDSSSSDSSSDRYSYFDEDYYSLMDTILQHSQLPNCYHCDHENTAKHPVYIFTDCDNLNLCAHCFSYLKLNSYPVCDNSPYTHADEDYKQETVQSDDDQSATESEQIEECEENKNSEQSTTSTNTKLQLSSANAMRTQSANTLPSVSQGMKSQLSSDIDEEHENTVSQHKSSSNSNEETEEDSYNYSSSSYYNDIGKSDEQYINKITHRRHNSFGAKRLDIGYYSEESWLYDSDNDDIM